MLTLYFIVVLKNRNRNVPSFRFTLPCYPF